MNSHSTQLSLKHLLNVEYAENVRSSHDVECECKLCHIPELHPEKGVAFFMLAI